MHVPECFVFRSLIYLSLQSCGSRFFFLSVAAVCVLLFDGFLVCVGYCMCACIDMRLSTCIRSRLKCVDS